MKPHSTNPFYPNRKKKNMKWKKKTKNGSVKGGWGRGRGLLINPSYCWSHHRTFFSPNLPPTVFLLSPPRALLPYAAFVVNMPFASSSRMPSLLLGVWHENSVKCYALIHSCYTPSPDFVILIPSPSFHLFMRVNRLRLSFEW